MLINNLNFGKKSKFCEKQKLWSENKFGQKIEMLAKNRTFFLKQKFWSNMNFWSKIKIFVKN